MRATVVITKSGSEYRATLLGKRGHQGASAGLTPYEAAATAAKMMVWCAVNDPEGGVLMAPPEVMDLVPEHLRNVAGNKTEETAK